MKKKVLAIILTLASVISMTACNKKENEETKKKKSKTEKTTAVGEDETGKESDTEDSVVSDTESVTESETESSSESVTESATETTSIPTGIETGRNTAVEPIWEYTEVSDFAPYIPTVETGSATAPDGTEITVYTTSLDATEEETIEKLRNDEYVRGLGVVVDYYKESGEANEEKGNQWTYKNAEGLVTAQVGEDGSQGLNYMNRFKLIYSHDTSIFTNTNKVTLAFWEVNIYDEQVQAELQRLTKEVFGEELGEILLFAQDANAAADMAANSLSVTVEQDGLCYVFHRWTGCVVGDEYEITFEMEIYKRHRPHPYDAGFQSRLSEFRVQPNTVFGGDIGNQDFTDINHFADVLYDSNDYGHNLPLSDETNRYSAERWLSEDGREYYIVEYHKFEPCSLMIMYELGLKDGVYDSNEQIMVVCDSVRMDGDLKEDRVVLLAEVNRMVQVMFGFDPDLKVEECDTEDEDGAIHFRIQHDMDLFGKVCNTHIVVNIEKGEKGGNVFRWYMAYRYETDEP